MLKAWQSSVVKYKEKVYEVILIDRINQSFYIRKIAKSNEEGAALSGEGFWVSTKETKVLEN